MALAFNDNFPLPSEWQLGKTLSESTVCLMTSGKYADVWFRCKDQEETEETDRIAAHRFILACRSPVFEAMFYGDIAETSDEIALPEIEKIPFLLFLRCLYSDTTDLSEENAIDVMKIAHKYQATKCQEFCSNYLQNILSAENVCRILESAFLFRDNALERATIDFIDDNALAVLKSEGFMHISQEALEYILKGNTFFAKEIDILKAVDEWSKNCLEGRGIDVNPVNKRTAIGEAFYFLRFPTLSPRDFMASQLRYGYLTSKEEKDISRFIIENDGDSQDLCTSCAERIPRDDVTYLMSASTTIEVKQPAYDRRVCEIQLTCTKEIELKEIMLSKKVKSPVYAKCTIEGSTDFTKAVVEDSIILSSNLVFSLTPPVNLDPQSSPYKLRVSITPFSGSPNGADSPVYQLQEFTYSVPQTTLATTNLFGSKSEGQGTVTCLSDTKSGATTSSLGTKSNGQGATTSLFGAQSGGQGMTTSLSGAQFEGQGATTSLFGTKSTRQVARNRLNATKSKGQGATSSLFGTKSEEQVTTTGIFGTKPAGQVESNWVFGTQPAGQRGTKEVFGTNLGGQESTYGMFASIPLGQEGRFKNQSNVKAHRLLTKHTQTDFDNLFEQVAKVKLDSDDGDNCFVNGIRYTNKSNRF